MLNAEVMPSEGPMDKVDVFLPLPLGADAVKRRGDENYNILVRLKPGVSIPQAQADIDAIASRIREKDKRGATFGMHVVGLQEQVVGDVRRALLVLVGSVSLVLLIACANVANLLLTRAAGREKEVAIRTALGAGWQRLVRQLLTESILLAILGGAAGLAIAEFSLSVVRAMNPGNIPRLEDIEINATVAAFTFGISLATGILFGLAPIWRAVKVDLNTSLKAGGRSGQTDGGLHLRRHRLRGLLVVSELALSLMLVIGAGLLVRSFVRLQSVPPGFTTDRVLTMQVAANGVKYREAKAVAQFYQEIESRIARLPGVKAEGVRLRPAAHRLRGMGRHQCGRLRAAARTGTAGRHTQRQFGLLPRHGDSARQRTLLLRARHLGHAAGGDRGREIRAALLAARRRHRQAPLVRSQKALHHRRRRGRGETVRPRNRRQDRNLLSTAAAAFERHVPGGAHRLPMPRQSPQPWSAKSMRSIRTWPSTAYAPCRIASTIPWPASALRALCWEPSRPSPYCWPPSESMASCRIW